MNPSLLAFWWLAAILVSAGYAPSPMPCPSNNTMIRAADSMSPQESAWLRARNVKTEEAIQEYLNRVGVPYPSEIRLDSQNQSRPIKIALAFSGGGIRALYTGAGEIAALDNRTTLATERALGGVLQSSSYIAGLSGGAWLVASLTYHNWPTAEEVVLENPYKIWDYTTWNVFLNTSNPMDFMYNFAANNYEESLARIPWWNAPMGKGIKEDLQSKKEAGFPVSSTDAWGRLLAHSLFRMGDDNWLESATWSGIRGIPAFANQDMPFPIVTALARRANSVKYDLNSPIIEFNPYEMGSFDTSINTFHDMMYLGTMVSNGVPQGKCHMGFDNAAFVVGTSSSLFNQFLNTLACPKCNQLNKVVKFFVRRFLKFMSRHLLDVAWYHPNPFYASQHAGSSSITKSDTLYLMDGGLAGEIIPLSTLAVKERELDLVFSFDNDGPEWPDGSSLINTYQRQFTHEGSSTVCPYVPGQSTFLHFNLTAKPTFFGCNASNLTALAKDGVVPPLVIYMANRPYEFYSNTSTYKITYTDNQKKGMVVNGFNIASQNNMTEFAAPPPPPPSSPKSDQPSPKPRPKHKSAKAGLKKLLSKGNTQALHDNSTTPFQNSTAPFSNATGPILEHENSLHNSSSPFQNSTGSFQNSTAPLHKNTGSGIPGNDTSENPVDQYNNNLRNNTGNQGNNTGNQGNNTSNQGGNAAPNWQTCVGCAMVRRAEERNNVAQTEQCRQCFEYYCWDGRLHEDTTYKPAVNFTGTGRTNEPMQIDKHNHYIHRQGIIKTLAGKLVPSLANTAPAWLL